MLSGLFKCKECAGLRETIKALEKHNAYLQRLTDKLLLKSGIAPLKKEKEEVAPLEEADEILARGGEIYGVG